MKIYLAADHNGFDLKNILREWLLGEGYQVEDLGAKTFAKDDDYPDFGIKLARAVAQDSANNVGIAICGSGVGMAVVSDKVAGVRAGLIHDPEIARAAKRDDDINVLALGARFISEDTAKETVRAWLETEFSGEARHVRRIGKIRDIENGER